MGLIGLLCSPEAQALTFSNWIAGYSVSNSSPGGDPDGDGIANLVEFALAGCDPSRPDGPAVLPRMVVGTRALGTALPVNDPSVIVLSSSVYPPTSGFWYLGLRYAPRAGTEGIRLRPQYSWWGAELGAWLDGRACFLAPVDAGGGEVIAWMQGMFRANTSRVPKSFVRLKVEEAD